MHRSRGFIYFIVALLAINWLSVLFFEPPSQTRVTVPFSPYFISAVNAGEVKSLTTKGGSFQGTFKTRSLPARVEDRDRDDAVRDAGAVFWNDSQLETLLPPRA